MKWLDKIMWIPITTEVGIIFIYSEKKKTLRLLYLYLAKWQEPSNRELWPHNTKHNNWCEVTANLNKHRGLHKATSMKKTEITKTSTTDINAEMHERLSHDHKTWTTGAPRWTSAFALIGSIPWLKYYQTTVSIQADVNIIRYIMYDFNKHWFITLDAVEITIYEIGATNTTINHLQWYLSYRFHRLLILQQNWEGNWFCSESAFCCFFQCLMCVERYLAVVHPVTFLKYKPLRYRVICSVITWGAMFGSSGIILMSIMFQTEFYFTSLFVQFFLFLSIQFFCCVAVLRALKQSGPGERGRERNEEKRFI